MRFTWLLVLAALLTASGPAAAQITVTPVRDLAFGPVIVGVPTQVGPSHPVRSGQFRLTAPLLTLVRFQLSLPNRLDGPAGARLPISYDGTSGIVVAAAPNSLPLTFNPRASQKFLFVTSTTAFVFVGGTVSPAGNQQQGSYAGTITITVNVF
jgi:hypothetical protein